MPIVDEFAKLWPREIFDVRNGKRLLASDSELLKKPGVYVLYRDEEPYYIGKANKALFQRLHAHANHPHDAYYNFWNLFSAFAVTSKVARDELEGVLIASMPTANSSQPKLNKIRMPSEVSALMHKLRQSRATHVIQPSTRENRIPQKRLKAAAGR